MRPSAPDEYRQYRGRYDQGWDITCDDWYQKQIKLGVLARYPAGTSHEVEAWDSESHQAVACRLQEAFAAFWITTINRTIVDGLKEMGEP